MVTSSWFTLGSFHAKNRTAVLFINVAVRVAAVHCEAVQIETGPIARRAKIMRGNELPDESV